MNDIRLGLPSASAFERLVYCPGSKALENSLPDVVTDDEDSQRGSRIHEAFQTGNTLNLSEEEEEAYTAGVKFTETLIVRWQDDFSIPIVTEGPREQRLWYHNPDDLSPMCSAQLDRHYLAIPYAHIIDLKSGWASHVPPATRSWQLRLQAIELWKEHPELTHIRVSYARALSKVGSSDWCDYTLSDLNNAERAMLQHIWESNLPDAPRRPGDWCRYCKGMLSGACREAAAYSLLPSIIAKNAVTNGDFDVDLAVSQMTAPDLVKIWQSSALITKVMDAVKARLKSMPDESLASLGIERGKGNEYNTVTDIKGAISILQMRGWDTHKIYDCMEFSNTKLAKQARIEKGLPSDKAASAWVKTTLAEAITKTTSEQPLKLIE